MNNREIFLRHVAQTSPAPMGIEVAGAEGVWVWDTGGRRYLDLISGFSVMNLGHGNPRVREAIHAQTGRYMHVMVYGEMIEAPQVQYARSLINYLPPELDCVYFTNSGSEATEGAMKLAKRVTGRSRIAAFNNAYHGSTQGALSIMGGEYWRNAYRPLLPDVIHLQFNSQEAIAAIDRQTACVVVEAVQAEAGAIPADEAWLQALNLRCKETGTLLIVDEIQTGFGRTGSLWAFEPYGIVPDILLLGKSLGGGMPLGAFISSRENMSAFTHNPVLGHISTFAGHPVSCAAGMAAFQELLALQEGGNTTGIVPDRLFETIKHRELIIRELIKHRAVKAVSGRGMLLAITLPSADFCQKVCHAAMKAGIITDWFLFAPQCIRVAPPLTITTGELENACRTLVEIIDRVAG